MHTTKISGISMLAAWLSMPVLGCAQAPNRPICDDSTPPAGATQVGAVQPLFRDCPRLPDLDLTGLSNDRKYYAGIWFGKPSPPSAYESAPDGLVLRKGAVLTTVRMNSYPGRFDLMNGMRPFYIEVQASTSSNNGDNFPAIWLMPIEHNLRLDDVYPPDPPGFERWFELDIDEGGFGPGGHHTAISWLGKWPAYTKQQNPKPTSKVPLDRTQPNVFGVSYDPATLTVRWWLNGEKVLEAGPPYVPEVARRQDFYLIVSAQSHRNLNDYKLKFMGVRAFTGAASAPE